MTEDQYEQKVKRLEEEIARGKHQDTSRVVLIHRKKIIEEILELRCPRCSKVFFDFVGCFALTCNNCRCAFCAYCLEDCGADAHAHVAGCGLNRAPGRNVYGNDALFFGAQRERKRGLVIKYFEEELQNPIAKQMLFDELSKGEDINDLGLTKAMLRC